MSRLYYLPCCVGNILHGGHRGVRLTANLGPITDYAGSGRDMKTSHYFYTIVLALNKYRFDTSHKLANSNDTFTSNARAATSLLYVAIT